MNWDAIGAIGEIIGALAVVVTLIYLSVQLKLNTASLKANSYQGWMSANIQINAAICQPELSKIIAAGNLNPKDLTTDTFVSYAMIHMSIMQMAQSIDYLYRSGNLDRELWHAEMNRAAGILAAPGVRQWWDEGGKTQLAPEFVERIEAIRSTIVYWDWTPEHGFKGKTQLGADRT